MVKFYLTATSEPLLASIFSLVFELVNSMQLQELMDIHLRHAEHGRGVDHTRNDDEKHYIVVEGEAKKQPKFQKELRHLEATNDAYAKDSAKEVGRGEAHRKEPGGKLAKFVKAVHLWSLSLPGAVLIWFIGVLNWFIGGIRLTATLAKSPEQDTCDVQRTDDDFVESVPRRNTAESNITVNLAGPGQPAELLEGLSVRDYEHIIEICPYLSGPYVPT